MSTDSYDEAIQFARNMWLLLSEVSESLKEEPLPFEEIGDMRGDEKGVSASHLDNLFRQVASNPDTLGYDELVRLAAGYLREDKIPPDWLALFAADVLEGKRKRPVKRGPDKSTNWKRDFHLFLTVKVVANKFNLPMYASSDISNKATAAEIVSKASNVNLDPVINAYKTFNKTLRG